MKKNKTITVFLFLLFIVFAPTIKTLSQNKQFDVFLTLQGLPTDETEELYEDKEGYLWIATRNGLCRYDGYQLKTYKSNLYTPNLLYDNIVNTISEDNNCNLWIGTPNGLVVMNKKTGVFRKIDPRKLLNNNIQIILTTHTNDVWIGTAGGLHRYVAEKDSFVCYTESNTNYQLLGNDIKTLIEDHRGNVWIGTWANGLSRFDPKQSRFYPYPRINQRNSAHILFQDNRNNIWVGSWGFGLFRIENPYDLKRVKYINYSHSSNPQSLSDNIVYSLSQDINSNTIWIGTRSGLSILNDLNNQNSFTNYLPNESGQSIPYNEVNSLIRDKSGNMWIGTLGGGVAAINTRKQMFNLERLDAIRAKFFTNSVRSIFVDDDNDIWLGIGSYGLAISNGDKYVYYRDHPDFKDVQELPTVNAVIQPIYKKEIWLATYNGGVFIYDKTLKKNRLTNITTKNTSWLCHDCVYALKEDLHHNIWIGTRGGLNIYNPKTKKGYAYLNLGLKSNDPARYGISTIEQDDEGAIWAGTENGLFKVTSDLSKTSRLKIKLFSVENRKIESDKILSIYKDKTGRLWVGTDGGGLALYDRVLDKFVDVNKKFNLPGDKVNLIIEDNSGNLWIGTNSGLMRLRISPANNSLLSSRLFTTSDGLQDNKFNRYAVCKTKGGELFLGGHKGYNHFYPEKLEEKNYITPIVITDIKIFNKSLNDFDPATREEISEQTSEFTNKVVLSHKNNNFSIEFSALSFSNPIQNKYAYKLVGFDKDWQYTDASRRFAYYNNLQSGEYQFLLKAANENGIWNERKAILEIEVLSPPWLTWWAYVIYFCLVVSLSFFIFKTARRRLQLRNALRIKDLEQAKTEELNHAKLQFFTNVTHEFLTPLTILSATLDELKIISPQNKDFYALMSGNISRLMRLLQQILEFRKAETGNLKLKVSKGDLAKFIKNTVDSFRPLMMKKKIHFSVICDPETILAYFDPDKLDKIIYNLLSNASKYNKPGGYIQVNVSLTNENKTVIISVKDDGEGISTQGLKTLFQRFYEGEYRRFNTIGTGIGLSLTKDLVQLHGGEISAESEIGKGTTFYVQIPVNREFFSEEQIEDYSHVADNTILEVVDEENINTIEESKEFTLLIVEDNDELLQVMIKLLKRDYNIFTARNGIEAIRVVEEQDITLVVSDIMMPVMDGIEFCSYVKNQIEISHIPVILLTAKDKEEDKIQAYESGADGFINKPFNLAVLKAKIKSLIKARVKIAQSFKKQLVPEIKELNYTSVDEKFLQKAIDCVYRHLDDADFDQQRFTDEMDSSKSSLYRKLKSLTGLNTSSFISNIRLKAACQIIKEKKKLRISELAYAVGFNDPKYFSTCFKKEFGMIPSEYLEKLLQAEQNKGDESS